MTDPRSRFLPALLLGLVLGLGLAAQAGAQTAGAGVPGPGSRVDWGGSYLGAQIGIGDIESAGDGPVGGLSAGYMADFGRNVLGVEASVAKPDIGLPGAAGRVNRIDRLSLTAGREAGRALIYATGGLARGTASTPSGEATGTGWSLGAGARWRLDHRTSLTAEAVYHDLGRIGGSQPVRALTLSAGAAIHF